LVDFIGALAFFLAAFFAAFFWAAFQAAFFLAGLRYAEALFFAVFCCCSSVAMPYFFFFLAAFFFADFFAAFLFVAMLELLLGLTKELLLPTGPREPAIRPPGKAPGRSNSSTHAVAQGRDPDGNGHAAAGFNAVLGAGDGTVGAGACAAPGAAGAATAFAALGAAFFALALATTTRFAFALRAVPALRTFLAARRTLLRAATFFTARLAFARLTLRFGLARAAAFFFRPAFVAIFMPPSV
jgi:hypothetical protein